MNDNVVQLSEVKSKTLEKKYRNVRYQLKYIVETKEWQWTAYFVSETKFSDKAKSMILAQKAAEKHIDKTLKLRGK